MSNTPDHTVRPLLFFPILAALVIVIVVGVIRIVPERSQPPETVKESPPTTHLESLVRSTDEEKPRVGEAASAGTQDASPTPPPTDSVAPPTQTLEEEPAADEALEALAPVAPNKHTATSDAEKPSRDFCEAAGWRLGPVSIATSVFGFRTVGDGGPRYAVAAAPDQRYLRVTVEFTRSGETPGAIVILPHDDTPSTLTLSGGGETYLPVGTVDSRARPWTPFRSSSVPVDAGSRARLTLAYLVPSALSSVVVSLEGSPCGELELPADERLAIHDLVGYWVRSSELVSSVRYENPIADAVVSRERVLLHFEPAGVDSVRATFPGPRIASTPLKRSPRAISAAFSLQWGEHTSPAWVRTADGGRRVLLYIGEPGGPVLMFEPAE